MGKKNRPPGPSGFAVVDKEAGWTSHDVVARARRVFDTRKVGHSGTLDPAATGVLVLGVGKATRLLRFITELPKSYVGEMALGTETSTLDAEGEVTATHEMGPFTLEEVQEVAKAFVGDIMQIPPMVSAIKIDGKRLHELAREGIEVERQPRPVTVHSLTVAAVPGEPLVFELDVNCSSGTYIRTLAADIGAALGGGAHLRSLRRTSIGSFALDQANLVDQATLLPLTTGMRDRTLVHVNDQVATDIRYGKVLPAEVLGVTGDGPWPVVDPAGELLAMYQNHRDGTVKPAVVVADQPPPASAVAAPETPPVDQDADSAS